MRMEKKSDLKLNEAFENIPRRFHILKATAKVIGSIFVFFGFLIIVLSYGVTYFAKDLPNPELIFMIAFALGWLITCGPESIS
jgi:hypothetical protein